MKGRGKEREEGKGEGEGKGGWRQITCQVHSGVCFKIEISGRHRQCRFKL